MGKGGKDREEKKQDRRAGRGGLEKRAWPLEGWAPSCESLEASGAAVEPPWLLDLQGQRVSLRAVPSPVLLEDESEAPRGGVPGRPRTRRETQEQEAGEGTTSNQEEGVKVPAAPRRWPPSQRWRHLWTSALFRREVNLNWSYRGSWLEN